MAIRMDSGDMLINLLTASTPGGIERQERSEQMVATRKKDRLPRFSSDHHSKENEAEIRKTAELFGFVYDDRPYDDLFASVTFPEGWEMRPSDHAMWSYLHDATGAMRGRMFYKGAFYDRSAFLSFNGRYEFREVKPTNWFELSHPTQPEQLYVEKKRRMPVRPGEYIDDRNPDVEYEHTFYMDMYGRKGYIDEDGYLQRGSPKFKMVKYKEYLPDDQQPAPILPQSYKTHYEFFDRKTQTVLFVGDEYETPFRGQLFEGEEAGQSYYTVEENRKAKANAGLLAAIKEQFPDDERLESWLLPATIAVAPVLPDFKASAILPVRFTTNLGRDMAHEVSVWAKCVNVSFDAVWNPCIGRFQLTFPELWMKLEFDRRFPA